MIVLHEKPKNNLQHYSAGYSKKNTKTSNRNAIKFIKIIIEKDVFAT
jgi:hypothetical protein